MFKKYRRRKLMRQPFPRAWLEIIERNVPYCQQLHRQVRERLEGEINVFLDEKHFEGCGGLTITDEIKVTIAAQACLLLLGLDDQYFDRLVSILVYPDAVAVRRVEGTGRVVEESEIGAGGLSWGRGVVVLSWRDVKAGGVDSSDGHNVVFHEFAHQLDHLDGVDDGAPVLESRAKYRSWARVLGREYETLRRDVRTGRTGLIDSYGATEPAEFFAVITELFFERPEDLRGEYPELYEELVQYYRQEPG